MYFSVDRITGKRAVLVGEDQKPLEVPLSMLPGGSSTGDMFFYQDGVFTPTPDKAMERRQRVADMLDTLLTTPEQKTEDP